MTSPRSTLRTPLAIACVSAAILTRGSLAADIASNPFTPGGDTLYLTATHPALGAAAPADSLSYAVTEAGTLSNDSAFAFLSEDREANSRTDVQRLETFLQTKLVVNYAQLTKYPKGAAVTAPWPSSYWPTYADGINYVWSAQSPMPPSEKYARAYGLNVNAFTQKISQTTGILSQSSRRACSSDANCNGLNDGSGCGKRKGERKGYCIPKWFGICHAWAPAAFEEREPRCAVTKNGVTFQPFDIKALITQVYDGVSLGTVFTGSRFNGPDSSLNMDSDGRYQDATRRDIGPGFFHIAIHNLMGMRQKSFVVDVDPDSQVWNQPVRAYEVTSATELTPAQAAQIFFAPRQTYPFNAAAQKIMFIQLKFDYVVEAGEDGPLVSTGRVDSFTTTVYYEYVLELDGSGDIVGGEWVRDSRKTHPDFLWFPQGQPSMDAVADVGIKYKDIRELLDASANCKALDGRSREAANDDDLAGSTAALAVAGDATSSDASSLVRTGDLESRSVGESETAAAPEPPVAAPEESVVAPAVASAGDPTLSGSTAAAPTA